MLKRIGTVFMVMAGVFAMAWIMFSEINSDDDTELVISSSGSATIWYEPITPLPQTMDLDARKVRLGEKLFNDVLLSKDKNISCAYCHNLEKGGSDGLEKSVLPNGGESDFNAPTVFNSGFNHVQFWDGRAKTLEEQVDFAIENPQIMGAKWDNVVAKIKGNHGYEVMFGNIYEDGVTRPNIKNAIATFELSLVTPNSRFDRYLLGETDVLTEDEKTGYLLFKDYGCVSCHQGVNVGGNMFHVMGVMVDYYNDSSNEVRKAYYGRYNVTGDEGDKFAVKVPSLRNIALTAPYFHDGSAASLEEAVSEMAEYQLGRDLPYQDLVMIVAFLETLTGEYKGEELK